MGHFILKYYWPVLYHCIRFLGICPLQRDGEENLKLTSPCGFWFRYLFILISSFLIQGLVQVYVFTTENIDSTEFMKALVENGGYSSGIDRLVTISNMILFGTLHFLHIAKTRTLAKGIILLQNYINKYALINKEELNWKMKHSYFKTIPCILLFFSGQLIVQIGMLYLIKSELGVSTSSTVALIAVFLIQSTVFIIPIFYFMFIYVELSYIFNIWCDEIKKLYESKSLLLQEAKYFIDGLNEIASNFAYFLFWITSICGIGIIFMGYTISTTTYALNQRWEKVCIFTGYVLMEISWMYIIYGMCTLSESVAKNVQELKKVILNTEFQTGKSNSVCLLLDEFRGFDANGYFTLNHSLLTNLTTNFVTFLVILVQFKQSESSHQN